MISSQDDWNDWYPSLKGVKKKMHVYQEKSKISITSVDCDDAEILNL